ncbi:hypothetical protein, partial [Paenibacillus aestuarii]
MNAWVASEVQSKHHRIAVTLFPIAVFLGYLGPFIFGMGMLVFFLVTSFKMLKKMLIYMLILGAISAAIPVLAPVIFIVMLVFFIMRIGYVIKNWRPFVAGLIVYGGAGIILARTEHASFILRGLSFSLLVESVIVAFISYLVLNQTLKWLYTFGYTSYSALGIMGSAPLIVISFILPFLKLHIGGDGFAPDGAVGHAGHAGHSTGSIGHQGDTYADGVTVKHVQGAESGQPLVGVKAHVRTAPDGDVTNNLSYQGPDAKAPNMEDLVGVKAHVRTAPDGDVTNNLSYQGPDAKAPNTED